MPYPPGSSLGRYEVLQFLGRGACGEVLLVKVTGTERKFAMKVVPCEVGSSAASDTSQKARSAALAEAQLLQSLRHPHIVSCEEVFYDSESHEIRLLLEHMDGGDVNGLIQNRREAGQGPFEAHFGRRLLAGVGGALHYIHAAGVLHRDVKPANVLLSRRSNRIKLADFGISKLVETMTLKAETFVGTPFYLSPEIVSGEKYGPPADCWALGVCLYEVAALHRPFEAGNQLALAGKICWDCPQLLPAGTADDVSGVIDGLLQKDQLQRLSLTAALSASPAISALVVSSSADAEPATPECLGPELEPAHPATSDGMHGFADTADSWENCELFEFGSFLDPVGDAAAAARAALGAEVDDPEELQSALLALERQRSAGGNREDGQACISAEVTAADKCDDAQAAALESLNEELRLRLGALRDDAANLLDGLLSAVVATGETLPNAMATMRIDEAAPASPRSAASCASGSSTPRGADVDDMRAAEEAIEVATNLGVDTEPAEERIACVRRMLSVRVVWGTVVKFCLLPVRVRFSSLVRAVAARFGIPAGIALQLCWREVDAAYPLDTQAAWEECLQRRGLTERPGRLELEIQGSPPPRRVRVPRKGRRVKAAVVENSEDAVPRIEGADFLVTGMQALPCASTAAIPMPSRLSGKAENATSVRSPPSGLTGGAAAAASTVAMSTAGEALRGAKRNATSRMAGKAWAASTGREQPIHWAPTPGGDTSGNGTKRGSSPSPGLGLCLEGRPAGTIRR